MAFDFKEVIFDEVIEIVSEKIPVDTLTKSNYISTENMMPNKGGVSEATALPSSRNVNRFIADDILFSNIRTYFEKVYLSDFEGGASPDVLIFRSKDANKFLPEYLYYSVTNKDFINFTVRTSKGAKMPRGDKGAIQKYKLTIPPVEIQQLISKTLRSFDKKIELNLQVNQTLDQMAQALFKSWFVNFDPVKAKIASLENGSTMDEANLAAMSVISSNSVQELEAMQTYHSERYQKLYATALHFPSAMQNSDLGEVPIGWEIACFGDVSVCYDRKRIPLSKSEREIRQGNIPYYGATSVMDHIDDYIFDDIYLLIGEDGSVHKEDGKPFIQYIWGKSWVNNHVHVLQGKSGISTEHLMLFMSQTNVIPYVTGAVQLKINQKNLNSIPFLKANKQVNELFNKIIEPIFIKKRQLFKENQVLTNIRDALLPKLLSGDMQIPLEDLI